LLATLAAIVVLTALLANIINQSFGLVAVVNEVEPEALSGDGRPLDELGQAELVAILNTHLSAGLLRRLESEQPLAQRDAAALLALVEERVVRPEIVGAWSLFESLTGRPEIAAELAQEQPAARLVWRAWASPRFIGSAQAAEPELAGARTAILGSLWTITITTLFAFPVGLAAAIYLEEYATNNWLNRLVQANISNLAGVPSIIYGMVGLAIFVRRLGALTSGAAFGAASEGATGRTILSAGLTLGLLVLPLIIISAQEAIRAVPASLRHASLALGATRWQTIWSHVLPSALPGILTGGILAISRAIGETAPLVVVGASTFVAHDPSGPFASFTTLPIQIYQWTARPQAEFRHLAAAAILVLLALLLSLNASAVLLRARARR
jgi:phosphate transport system permease protein